MSLLFRRRLLAGPSSGIDSRSDHGPGPRAVAGAELGFIGIVTIHMLPLHRCRNAPDRSVYSSHDSRLY